MTLAHSDKHKIADALVGTASSGYAQADQFSASLEDVVAAAASCGVSRCAGCDFWCPTTELDKDDRCEDCTQ